MVLNSPRDAGTVLSQLAPCIDAKGALRDLQGILSRAPERLAHPVRLAVVGQIKRGKSTLVNALIGQRLAATGPLETTFRVNEFKYGDRELVRAFYCEDKTGTIRSEEVPLDALADLTVRDSGREAELARLRRIVVALPEPLLRSFELIDTPGLYSVYVEDSENALEVIGRERVAEMTRASAEELGYADAVLYLFSRDLGSADTEVVGQFLGHGGSHALGAMRAIGVVSKCDAFWPPPRREGSLTYNPIEEFGREKIRGYLAAEPELGRLFYDIIPIAGLVAEGAQTIPAEWFNWLHDLASREPEALLVLLRYRSAFTNHELSGISLSAQQRRHLDSRLGPWGIMLACRYLRDHCTEQQVREQLVIDSGVQRVRDLAVSHFSMRKYLIKLDRILSVIRDITTALPEVQVRSSDLSRQVALVQDAVEEITDREEGLRAMEVLRLAGQGRLPLAMSEVDRLYRLLEPGSSCAARLGRPDDAPPADLIAVAGSEVSYWQQRADDVTSVDPEAIRAVRLVLRTAEGIYHRVSRADQLLRQADELRDQARLLLD
jgi:hypothetical protein